MSHSIRSLETELQKQGSTQKTVIAEVDGLFKAVESLAARNNPPGGGGGASSSEFTAFKADVINQVSSLKQAIAGGGPIKIGKFTFDGAQSVSKFLLQCGVTGIAFYHVLDPVGMMCALESSTKHREDYQKEAILNSKCNKSPQLVAISASFETSVPGCFAGQKGTAIQTDSLSHRCVLNGVKCPSLWNQGDLVQGVKNFLIKAGGGHL